MAYLGNASRPCHPLQKSKNIFKISIISDFMHGVSLFYYENQHKMLKKTTSSEVNK